MTPKVWVKVIAFAAAAGLLLIPAHSQSKGGTPTTPPSGTGTTGTPGTTGTTGTTGRTTTSTTNNPNNTQNPTTPSSIPQPIFVTGRVMLEDGTAPPEPVVIETV